MLINNLRRTKKKNALTLLNVFTFGPGKQLWDVYSITVLEYNFKVYVPYRSASIVLLHNISQGNIML